MVEKKGYKFIIFIANIIVCCIILLPIIYAFFVSLMEPSDILKYPPNFIPPSVTADNYTRALELAPIFRFILNSLIVSASAMLLQLITGSLAAYSISLLNFKGKNIIFLIMLSTMMIPGQAIIIANYLTISSFGLLDTIPALILPYMTSAFCVFNMRQAFLQLPGEIREAAVVDGASNFQYLIRVALPLVKPSLGSLGIYTFLQVWNQYLWPLLVTNTATKRTVQIGIGMLQNSDGNAFGPIMAGAVMVLLPSIIAFIVGQKQLVSGLTAGSVKG